MSNHTEIRRFGFSLATGLSVIGFFASRKGLPAGYIPLLLSPVVLAAAFFPWILRPVFIAFTFAGNAIGRVVTMVVLAVVFFTVITVTGLLGRLFGHSFIVTRFKGGEPSYWVPKEQRPFDPADCEKQF